MGNDIANNLMNYRSDPMKKTKYEYEECARHLSKVGKVKLYEYYTCAYCGKEIIIGSRDGGVVDIPDTLTKGTKIKLALHNKCIRPVINQLENKNMFDNNYNHIPRID